MLEMYLTSEAGVVTPVGTSITFTNKKLQSCCEVTSGVPSNTIQINGEGLYEVTFNGVMANNTAAAGEVGVQLFNNGVADNVGIAEATSTGATDFVNLAFTTIVYVRPCCQSVNNRGQLTFRITGVDALITFADAIVRKIGDM